ncbi:L-type lectin-domain containing receptor kinase VII.1, partial [Linum grandiflorum]
FNSANSTNSTANLLLYGSAAVDAEILTLANSTAFTIGRALFPQKIRTRNSSHALPFSMAPYENALPGHILVFLFVPFTGISGASSSQNLGFLNRTNDNNPNTHVFGVEFDVFANQEFNGIDDNHVGIDLNSLTSRFANLAGYWPDSGRGGSDFKPLKLNNGENYQRQERSWRWPWTPKRPSISTRRLNVQEMQLSVYDTLLGKLPETKKGVVQRSMGLKMEQLKAEVKQLED